MLNIHYLNRVQIMELIEAIENRHSVRNYLDKPIDDELIIELQTEIETCNQESGLHIQLITNDAEAFSGFKAHYGKFTNVRNYICMVGKKGEDLDEKVGYYGERIVLKAQRLGLNTCWVALTYSKRKSKCSINKGEKLLCVISLGYGATQGVAHKSRSMDALCKIYNDDTPEWFIKGMEAAMLAPTAINQQKFRFTLSGDSVNAESMGGPYSNVDLGIVKYHFEIGAGSNNFKWGIHTI